MNQKAKKWSVIAILTIIALVVVGRIAYTKHSEYASLKNVVKWRAKEWPTEKKMTAKKVKERQFTNETHNAVMINLKPYINAKLKDAPLCWKGNNANNLSELRAGSNTYAGVPFDVEGSVQLMGGWMKHYGKNLPMAAKAIPVHKQCAKIHLFHGAGSIKPEQMGTNILKLVDVFPAARRSIKINQISTNVAVAKLVIHYVDGATNELNILAGLQVCDWWSPTFVTGIPDVLRTLDPNTELAWVGSNAYLRKWMPDFSLCLYRTSFENPRPDVEISTLDYVSTQTIACPFLLGLTVEKSSGPNSK